MSRQSTEKEIVILQGAWPGIGGCEPMRRSMGRLALLFALGLLVAAPAALAEEGRPPAPATLLLKLLNVPMDSPEVAFKESLRSQPAPRPNPEWEILPDGSARYGTATVSVIVKNPCPEGAHKPFRLPGRAPR